MPNGNQFQGQGIPNNMYLQKGMPGPQGYQAQNPVLRSNSPSITPYTPAPSDPMRLAPTRPMVPTQYRHYPQWFYNPPPPPPQPQQRQPPNHPQHPGGTRGWAPMDGLPPPGKQTVDILTKGEIRIALDNLKRSSLDPATASQQRTVLKRRLAQLEAGAE